jgi:tripartite-type tricarboxylate transporter receptor subunit TctC
MKRRNALGLLGSAALLHGTAHTREIWAQETWPTKPIKIVVPFGPGGSGDIVSRIVAHELEPMAGQPFIIENKPGATAMIGTAIVKKTCRPTATRSCMARPRASRPIPACTSR